RLQGVVHALPVALDSPRGAVDRPQDDVDGPQAAFDALEAAFDSPQTAFDAPQAAFAGAYIAFAAAHPAFDHPDTVLVAFQHAFDTPLPTVPAPARLSLASRAPSSEVGARSIEPG